jgi:hypothetical protein
LHHNLQRILVARWPIVPGVDDEFDGGQPGIIGTLSYNVGQETAGVVAGNETRFRFGILVPNVIQNSQNLGRAREAVASTPANRKSTCLLNSLQAVSCFRCKSTDDSVPRDITEGASSTRSVGPVPLASPVSCYPPNNTPHTRERKAGKPVLILTMPVNM